MRAILYMSCCVCVLLFVHIKGTVALKHMLRVKEQQKWSTSTGVCHRLLKDKQLRLSRRSTQAHITQGLVVAFIALHLDYLKYRFANSVKQNVLFVLRKHRFS